MSPGPWVRSHDPKFPSASGKPSPDYKGPRDLPPLRLFSLVFGQCLGKDRGQKGVPKWTNRWDFNRQNSGEMNHNWQGLTGSWIFWGACLPPLNPSVPSGIDSGTQAPSQHGSAVFSPRPPGFPGDSLQSAEASAAGSSAEGAGPFWLVYHLFRRQAPSPSASVSLRSGSGPRGPSPRTLP